MYVYRCVFDLATDKTDNYIAVIENLTAASHGFDDSVCRLYEVGKKKPSDESDGEHSDSGILL